MGMLREAFKGARGMNPSWDRRNWRSISVNYTPDVSAPPSQWLPGNARPADPWPTEAQASARFFEKVGEVLDFLERGGDKEIADRWLSAKTSKRREEISEEMADFFYSKQAKAVVKEAKKENFDSPFAVLKGLIK